MLGTGLQFGTVRGEESIYIPVKARKNYNQQKQGRKPKSEKNENPDTNSKMVASDNRSPKEASNSSKKQLLEPSITPTGNLDRLLESTTPLVPAQYFSKVNPLSLYLVFPGLLCLVGEKIWGTFEKLNCGYWIFIVWDQ